MCGAMHRAILVAAAASAALALPVERRLCGTGGGGGETTVFDAEACAAAGLGVDAAAFVCASGREAGAATHYCFASDVYAAAVDGDTIHVVAGGCPDHSWGTALADCAEAASCDGTTCACATCACGCADVSFCATSSKSTHVYIQQ